ncbi:hypothetical protein VRB95_06280 [Erwinia aphidicola]|uniref:hypothetical protein n=1 Tax=Erwinia aphidicola TaxID=68334 RepID=UPI0030D3C8B6
MKNKPSAEDMMAEVAAQIMESITLLRLIYREIPPELPETDEAIACLLRSMRTTASVANGYIDVLRKENS